MSPIPDINQGLEIGGEPVVSYEEGDVNTQSGFEAGIARALTGETATPEEGTEEAAPETEEIQAPEDPAPEEAGPEDDWREKYEEAQRIISRQGNELGALRSEMTEFRDAYAAPTPAPATAGPFNAEAMLNEYGGQETIDWAIDNAPEHIEAIARTWALSGDPEGAVFYADYRAEQALLNAAPPASPEPDPTLTQVSTERKLAQVFREAREQDKSFGQYELGIGPALSSEETPLEIKAMLLQPINGSIEDMRRGLTFLKPYARMEVVKSGVPATPPGQEPPKQATQAEETRREAARRTAIVTGSQRLQAAGTEPEAGELDSEQRIARFKEMFEQEPDTSIAAGLTINGQPVLPQRPRRPS